MEELLKNLARRPLIDLLSDKRIRAHIDEKTYALYAQRAAMASEDDYDAYLIYDDDDDDDEDEELVWNEFNGCAQDMSEEIEEWFETDDPPESATLRKKSMSLDLRRHLDRGNARRISHAIEDLTIVPETLRDFVEACVNDAPSEEMCETLDRAQRTLKFEILEEFIGNHDFKSKEKWVDAMETEYQRLSRLDMFPESVMDAFEDALQEIRENLTIDNIREIKRLVSES